MQRALCLHLSRSGHQDMGADQPELWDLPEPAGIQGRRLQLVCGSWLGTWQQLQCKHWAGGTDAILLLRAQAGLRTMALAVAPVRSSWKTASTGVSWAGLLRQLERTVRSCLGSCVCGQAPASGRLIRDQLMTASSWAMTFQHRVFTRLPCPT